MTLQNKKLIEVALPLNAINTASVRESYIYRGNPSALHKWWAQRPMAAARAVIFAQMVDDPSTYVDVLRGDQKLQKKAESTLKARRKLWEEAKGLADRAKGTTLAVPDPGPVPTLDEVLADQERQRLFRIIEDLVLWENNGNENVLQAARDEIWQSWRRACAINAGHPQAEQLFDRYKLPTFHDPFAGGGTLPLEAQRLGLEGNASDLNPVAVLITKALTEIPPGFDSWPPVNCEGQKQEAQMSQDWHGTQGLAEDVRFYGKWIHTEAVKRIGHLYPRIEVTPELSREREDLKVLAGQQLTVIGWLWARTVKSPNPAFAQVDVPLASTFLLSTRVGKEVFVEPMISVQSYRFVVKLGKSTNSEGTKSGTKLSRGANFQCLMSGAPIEPGYIYGEARAGRLGARLMAIVAESSRGRIYLDPTAAMEDIATSALPSWKPELAMPENPRWFSPPLYGLKTYGDLFTSRQLVTLTTLSDLVQEARERVRQDAMAAGLAKNGRPLHERGTGAEAYADSVAVLLAFSLSKTTDYNCALVPWYTKEDRPGHLFSKQAIPMVWDFVELNPLADIGGTFAASCEIVAGALSGCPQKGAVARVSQRDAVSAPLGEASVISTDPPYYDNIGYADLSDFFYVWLRRSLRPVFPELFATLAVPKAEELVATAYRHGGREKAEIFFLSGMTAAMHRLSEQAHPAYPVTIYYAFKQSETRGSEGTTNTGWDTFLAAVIEAGFSISGTWPMRTERGSRSVGIGTNSLASSVVLVCRRRAAMAPNATRREFLSALQSELPQALSHLQRGNIAPVDLAQAAIGPGMAVFTRYAKVLDAEGKALSVREALSLINQTLDQALAEQEGDFDADSRWALTWFEQVGFAEGDYGLAEQLSKSKNTSVAGMVEAGIVSSRSSRVRLLRPAELPADWDPSSDPRLTAWEIVHQLIRALESGGESEAAMLVAKLGAKAEVARELCYRLYTLCERKKRAPEALSYNGLVLSWPEIMRMAQEGNQQPPATQSGLFADEQE